MASAHSLPLDEKLRSLMAATDPGSSMHPTACKASNSEGGLSAVKLALAGARPQPWGEEDSNHLSASHAFAA